MQLVLPSSFPRFMTVPRSWQYGALAIVVLAGLLISFPSTNAQSAEDVRIDEMRLLVTWGDVDNSLGTVGSGTTIAWDGEISIDGGKMRVIRPLFFQDENDRLLDEEGATIRFQSDILSNMDGVFLRVLPQNGRTEQITFQVGSGITIHQPILSFATQKEFTYLTPEGLSVRMQAENVSLAKGTIRTQIAARMESALRSCMQNGKTETECKSALGDIMERLREKEKMEIWTALRRELTKWKDPIWAGSALHPDMLFLLSPEELASLTKTDLARMDLSKLSHMTDAVYKTLLRLAQDRLGELSPALLERGLLLEGFVPATLRAAADLSEEQFQAMKRFLSTLDPTERTEFIVVLSSLSPSIWQSIKQLDDISLRSLGRFLITSPEAKREAIAKAYARQALKIQNLRTKLDQVRSLLSASQGTELDALLAKLSNTLFWSGDATPMILSSFDAFLARSGAISRDNFGAELRALATEVQQALAENAVGLQKEDLGLFTDVPAEAWYAGFVGLSKKAGILSGYKDASGSLTGHFGPEKSLTVAELLKISLGTSGAGTSTGSVMMPGAANHWSKGYVARAEELHISLVASAENLNRPATRAEVIQTFIEAYGINPSMITSSSFSDVFPSMKAARFIEFAKQMGIISGDAGATTFRPDSPINRAEVAKIATLMQATLSTLFSTSTVEGTVGE